MRIGFDLDRIFINYPPFVPSKLIDWLYRNHTDRLSYRIPHLLPEIWLRKLSHLPIFRPAMRDNVRFVQELGKDKKHQLFLISGRYSFLHDQSFGILKKYGLITPFEKIYLNDKNEQSHLFKSRIIKEEKIDLFIDDDADLINYLHQHCPGLQVCLCRPPLRLDIVSQFLT
jgi:hypothetical protein